MWLPNWANSLLRAVFLMTLGYMANQFLAIPIQQQRQDDRIQSIEQRLDRQEKTLEDLKKQLTKHDQRFADASAQ